MSGDWDIDPPAATVDAEMLELMYAAETIAAEEAAESPLAPQLTDHTSTPDVDWPSMPSLADFFARTNGPIDWLWDGMIMRGSVNILGAYMKVGKSTLVMNIVQGLIERSMLFDREMHLSPEGRVFWFASEDAERIIRYNLDHAKITPEVYAGRLVLVTKGQPYLDALRAEGNRNLLWQSMKAALTRDRCEVLVLDTINTFSAYLGLEDENNNQMVTELMDKVAELKTLGITVILTQHTGKNAERGGTLQSLRGASAYAALADQIMLLGYPGNDNKTTKRLLTIIGRTSVDSPPFLNLDYVKDSAAYIHLPDDAEMESGGPDDTLAKIEYWMIRSNMLGPLSQALVREAGLGIRYSKIQEAFQELKDCDGVFGRLRLNDRGRIVLAAEEE